MEEENTSKASTGEGSDMEDFYEQERDGKEMKSSWR